MASKVSTKVLNREENGTSTLKGSVATAKEVGKTTKDMTQVSLKTSRDALKRLERISKEAREKAESNNMADKITFVEADVMKVNLSEASVILCYLYPTASAALRPKFEKELKQGTRIVMESFEIPGWEPAEVKGKNSRRFYLYIMPPKKKNWLLQFVEYLSLQIFKC